MMVNGASLTIDAGRRLATLVVGGDCDVAMRSRVQPLLREASDADVQELEVEFRAAFADCSAIHLVDDACRALGRDHVSVRACATVERIFELTRTSGRFGISACC